MKGLVRSSAQVFELSVNAKAILDKRGQATVVRSGHVSHLSDLEALRLARAVIEVRGLDTVMALPIMDR